MYFIYIFFIFALSQFYSEIKYKTPCKITLKKVCITNSSKPKISIVRQNKKTKQKQKKRTQTEASTNIHSTQEEAIGTPTKTNWTKCEQRKLRTKTLEKQKKKKEKKRKINYKYKKNYLMKQFHLATTEQTFPAQPSTEM
jgi:hydroxylamine reductase (hybrid-cluster protein)